MSLSGMSPQFDAHAKTEFGPLGRCKPSLAPAAPDASLEETNAGRPGKKIICVGCGGTFAADDGRLRSAGKGKICSGCLDDSLEQFDLQDHDDVVDAVSEGGTSATDADAPSP